MEIVHSLPIEKWRRFVNNHPQGNIFHTPEMFQVFSHTKGYRPQFWAVVQDEQIFALFLPIQISIGNGIFHLFTSRAVVYGGVLCAPGKKSGEALKMLLHNYNCEVKSTLLFTEMRNTTDSGDIQQELSECGFNFEEHLNYLIDLTLPEETIWYKLSKKTRQHVQKARNSSLIVEEMLDQHNIEIAYQLLHQVYKRVHVPLADISLFQSAFDILLPRGMMKAIMVRKSEHFIGFNIFLLYKDKIYDWFRGSDRNFSNFQPESLLLWHTFQWGQRNNFHFFDFGGAGKPGEHYGPRDFKAKFGGNLVNYGRNICVHAPLRLKFTKIGYQIMRKFL